MYNPPKVNEVIKFDKLPKTMPDVSVIRRREIHGNFKNCDLEFDQIKQNKSE